MENWNLKKKEKRTIVIGAAVLIVLLSVAFIVGYIVKIRIDERIWEEEQQEQLWEKQRLEAELERQRVEAERLKEEQQKELAAKERDELLYREIDWEMLQQKNADIYAWISIPELAIDYPVLQGSKDDFYLNHDENGNKLLQGSIYSNSCTNKDFSDTNTILYGHNMKDGSMFGNLSDAAGTNLAEEALIYVYTKETTYVYQMIALVEFGDGYLPDLYGIRNEKGTRAFLTAVEKSPAWFLRDKEIPEEEELHLLTLSTCTGAKGEKRCLLVAQRTGQYPRNRKDNRGSFTFLGVRDKIT